jgi:hypothetical protein
VLFQTIRIEKWRIRSRPSHHDPEPGRKPADGDRLRDVLQGPDEHREPERPRRERRVFGRSVAESESADELGQHDQLDGDRGSRADDRRTLREDRDRTLANGVVELFKGSFIIFIIFFVGFWSWLVYMLLIFPYLGSRIL